MSTARVLSCLACVLLLALSVMADSSALSDHVALHSGSKKGVMAPPKLPSSACQLTATLDTSKHGAICQATDSRLDMDASFCANAQPLLQRCPGGNLTTKTPAVPHVSAHSQLSMFMVLLATTALAYLIM